MNGESCMDHKTLQGVRRREIRRLAAAVLLVGTVAASGGVHRESNPPAVPAKSTEPAKSTRPVVPKAPPTVVEPEPEEMTAEQAAIVAQE